jgi:thioredoxin-like negative regulator of GroEL
VLSPKREFIPVPTPKVKAISMSSQNGVPMLLFFTASTSGPARRMESLLAHLARKERARLRIARIDTTQSPEWVERLGIEQVPTLVLLKDRRVVARLEGRASAPKIERMLAPHLAPPEMQAA